MNQAVPDHATCTNTGAWIFRPSKGEQALALVTQLLTVLTESTDLPKSVVEAVEAIRRSA